MSNADTTELLERLTQDAASALNTRLEMLELALNKISRIRHFERPLSGTGSTAGNTQRFAHN
jgi:hypothetical protein